MSAARFASLLLSALCLSACAAGPYGEAVGRYPTPASGDGGGNLLAVLPAAAGRVVGVRRLPYANGFGQEIVLDGPPAMAGENLITVQAITTPGTGGRGAIGEELRLGPASDTEIAAEMTRLLPGLTMRIAEAPERDADGAFGYAAGTRGRLACVYAWQYLAPPRPVSLVEGLSDTGALPMSVRVRLCREQPVAALLAVLRGFRVSRPGAGGNGAGLHPAGDALEAAAGWVGAPAATTGSPTPETDDTGSRPGVAAARLHGRLHHRDAPAPPRRSRSPGQPRHVARRTAFHLWADRADQRIGPVPPLPMPSDVAVAMPDAPRRSMAARTPTSGDDGLPMPR